MMIIGKKFEGMMPTPPEKPLGNAVSTVRTLRARRDKRAMLNMKKNNIFTGEFKTKNLNAPFTYTGQIKNGIPYGKGIAKFHDKWEGHTYEGEFKDCNMHGRGVYTEASGTKYVGEWKDGKQHGHAVITFADGGIYDGEWKYGNRDGHGVYTVSLARRRDIRW